jgi:hypothetical protein
MHIGSKALSVLTLATMGIASSAAAGIGSVVYQNTTTQVGSFLFEGAAAVGTNLAANIDINQLTLAAGSAGLSITSLSFLAANFNAGAVEARPTIYIWAANGAGGNPGTLLGEFVLSDETLTTGINTINYTVPGGLLIPASLQIWAGIGFDNDNGASPITDAELSALGGLTYHPATVGTDGPNAVFLPPGSASSNPAVIPFGTASGANYGWTVTAALIVQPGVCVPFPVTLAAPAGPIGAYLTLISSDPSIVTFEDGLNPINLSFPADSTTPSGRPLQVCGVNFGSATITSFGGTLSAGPSIPVEVTATLSFAPASVTTITSTQERLTLTLSSPAPAGGVTVNLSSDNPAVATVPATATIPANGTSVIVPVTGVAAGATLIRASVLPFVPDTTAGVTVQ